MNRLGWVLVNVFLLTCTASATSHAAETNNALATPIKGTWDAYIAAQYRSFFEPGSHLPGYPAPDNQQESIAFQPHYNRNWDDNTRNFDFTAFFRSDSMDPVRSHWDIRELLWRLDNPGVTWRAGIGKVFWGVTESNHLVDVINQTDQVEDVNGTEKLGQPMLRATFKRKSGSYDFYILPYFRTRDITGSQGRPGSGFPFEIVQTKYQSPDAEHQIDVAFRWTQTYGDLDIGLSYFYGTNRTPQVYIPTFTSAAVPSLAFSIGGGGFIPSGGGFGPGGGTGAPIPAGVDFSTFEAQIAALGLTINDLPPAIQAALTSEVISRSSIYYSRLNQAGLEALYLLGEWTLKMETVYRDVGNGNYWASVMGGERTYSGIFGTPWDLTLFIEYNWDSRGQGLAPLQNDIFLGTRIALNDTQSTEITIGNFSDLNNASQNFRIEAARRISDNWKARFVGQAFHITDPTDPMYAYHDDSYAMIELLRYF